MPSHPLGRVGPAALAEIFFKAQLFRLLPRQPGVHQFCPAARALRACDRVAGPKQVHKRLARLEPTGVLAADLDDCGRKCLALVGKRYPLESDAELAALAGEQVKLLAKEQKYVRGAFSGGTYMDEAMQTLVPKIGKVYSNKPPEPAWALPDSQISTENTCIDYGEEEFTLGRPHPAIDPGVREPAIPREAADPETAVILLDYILTPPGHPDPAGYSLADIRAAQRQAEEAGRHLIFIASVLGTTADLQNLTGQEQKLRDAGVIVCRTNERAAALAGEIIRQKKGEGRT